MPHSGYLCSKKIEPESLNEILKMWQEDPKGSYPFQTTGKKMARDKNLRPCLPLKPQEKGKISLQDDNRYGLNINMHRWRRLIQVFNKMEEDRITRQAVKLAISVRNHNFFNKKTAFLSAL